MSVRVPQEAPFCPSGSPLETPSALKILPENSFCPQESTGNPFLPSAFQPRTPFSPQDSQNALLPSRDSTRTPSALWIPSETTFCPQEFHQKHNSALRIPAQNPIRPLKDSHQNPLLPSGFPWKPYSALRILPPQNPLLPTGFHQKPFVPSGFPGTPYCPSGFP